MTMIRTYPRALIAYVIMLAVAVAMIAGTVVVIAGAHRTDTLTRDRAAEARDALARVKQCYGEDGADHGDTVQTYPCTWPGDVLRGDKRVTLYVRGTDGGCFEPLPADVRCYDIDAEGWYAPVS